RAPLALGIGMVLSAPPVAGQERLFPAVRSFELPEASPRVHGMVGRIISVRRGDSRFGEEREGEAVLGENFPVLALKQGPRPIILGFGSQVYGRFSLADAKSSLISIDWLAGVNTTAILGPWALTLELYHESSHLGDEYGERFEISRLDWTREVLTGWVAYGRGRWRVTGGASYVFQDELNLPKPAASLGLDFRGRARADGSTSLHPVFGVFTEATSATNWRLSTSAKVGMAWATPGRNRQVGMAIIAHDGLSTQRQFFRQESQYLGVEVRFDL
ncbi:MAG TPA: DUF1207 domain-containing protein, partial [Gemmatimonadales bacterium]|nr:DUF1207 domain-containing protein [Gemmatimonadales bacterium]